MFTPYPETTDFSSFLLQAQSSGAKVLAFANSGTNTTNCIKQAAEFGLQKSGMRLAALLLTIADVHAMGLQVAQGLMLVSAFYWDRDEGSRTWSRSFAAKFGGRMPTMFQAGDYSAITHYLKAVQAMDAAEAQASGRAVVARMKQMPTDDPLFGSGSIRLDGRKLNPMYLFQVKAPDESGGEWDCYKLLASIPGDEAFRPLSAGNCPLNKA